MAALFMTDLQDFQADYLAPIMPSDKRSNTYYKLDKNYWFSDIMQKRGPGVAAVRKGWGTLMDSFLIDVWAVGKDIDDQTRANADDELQLEATSMKFVARAERLNREKRFYDAVWNAAAWSNSLTGNTALSAISAGTAGTINQWNDANSTPINDVQSIQTVSRLTTGMAFTDLAIGQEVFNALKSNTQILDRITGGSTSVNPANVTKELISNLLGINLVVLSAVENTAGLGNAMTGQYIFGKQGLFMHRDNSPGMETPTAIRTITWQQYAGNKNGTRIMKWRDESIHSDIIEMESAYVHKIVAPDLGLFVNGLVA
jgi:hypothetical protein